MREESPAQNSNSEKGLIELTLEELTEYTRLPPDNPKLLEWMASKGLEFSENEADEIDVIVDGENRRMVVSENDFGTLLPEPWTGPQH